MRILLFIFISTTIVSANVGYYTITGQGPGSVVDPYYNDDQVEESTSIRMLAEDIDITLFRNYVAVSAWYDFENTSSSAQTVSMYFPLEEGTITFKQKYEDKIARDGDLDVYPEKYDDSAMQCNFDLAVRGVSADYGIPVFSYLGGDGMYQIDGSAVWEVAFLAGETVRVNVEYTTYYGHNSAPFGGRDFKYALYTGGGWNGTIGKGVVTIRPGDGFNWDLPILAYGIDMPYGTYTDDNIEWRFNGLEPVLPKGVPAYGGYFTGSSVVVILPRNADANYDVKPVTESEKAMGIIGKHPIFVHTKMNDNSPNALDSYGEEIMLYPDEEITLLVRKRDWFKVRHDDGKEQNDFWLQWISVDKANDEEILLIKDVVYY